jgi:uncharacterized protein
MKRYPDFKPPVVLKNPFVQSYLASTNFRALGRNPLIEASREMIITTPDNTRLLGFYSPHPRSKGTLLLLHGWEGSAESTYVRCTGRYFFERGYSIFRLNLRDHGDSHHLNIGIFFGSLFKEVFDAVVQVSRLEADRPFFLAGFSLGGNYVLRLAIHAGIQAIYNLEHAVAVSPVLDPARTTALIDSRPSFRYYFLRKWRRSLVRKQAAFPGKYDFRDIHEMKRIYDITAMLLRRYSGYKDIAEYFDSYTLTGGKLGSIAVPTTIISAKDDPIIPLDDFENIAINHKTRVVMQSHGGHNGFIESMDLSVWYQPFILEIFRNALPAH